MIKSSLVLLAYYNLSFTIDSDTPPSHSVLETYLSFNVDTGSLYNSFDWSDPYLLQLGRNLAMAAPTEMRIGGGAANDVLVTGPGGARGNCSTETDTRICVDDGLWDEINGFAAQTGLGLVWDFNILLQTNGSGGGGEWDASNASHLIQRTEAMGYRLAGWQLGNEEEDMIKHGSNITAASVASAFRALSSLLAAHPTVQQRLTGPDSCCELNVSPPGSFLTDFVAGTRGLISAITVHDYPLGRDANRSCVLAEYTNLTQFKSLPIFLANYTGYIAAAGLGALSPPLILGEVASTAEGGCDGASNRFVAGFVFLYTLSAVAEAGVLQVNRQDLAGWSAETVPSNYGLAGVPGWSNRAADGLPLPHPDYFLAILFKQLVGRTVLNSSYAAGEGGAFDSHVWCSKEGGNPVITFINMQNASAQLSISSPAEAALVPRTEYFITSVPDPTSSPPDLYGDTAYLNGALLALQDDGSLPVYPLPGNSVTTQGEDLVMPPWSYGFIVLNAVTGAVC